jgi:hypothetical protein
MDVGKALGALFGGAGGDTERLAFFAQTLAPLATVAVEHAGSPA